MCEGHGPALAGRQSQTRQDLIDHIEGTGLYPKDIQNAMEGFRVEHHGIICLLEGSLWLLFADWVGERREYCLLVSSASGIQRQGPPHRGPPTEVSIPGGLREGSPL